MFKLKEIIKATKAKLIKESNHSFVSGVSTDSRTVKENEAFFALIGDKFDGHNFINEAIKKGAAALVASKEVKNIHSQINILKVDDTTIALGNLAKYHRAKNNIPLIAVIGSVGKTTAKDIIANVLSGDYKVLKNLGTYNNHIGVPQALFQLTNEHNISILELGTNHSGEISYLGGIVQPQIAVITNIGPSHLEYFKDLRGVFKEKKSIIKYLKGPKILLLNGDDSFLREIKLPSQYKVFYFGIKDECCNFMASQISLEDGRVSFVFNKKHKFSLNSIGRFNIYNALAGIACGLIFGIEIKKIKEALEYFQFPEQRFKKIDFPKFSVLDDTYNSNPLSLRGAIDSLVEFKTDGRKIFVMGDMLELGNMALELHQQIGSLVAQKSIDMFLTLGELSKAAAKSARKETKDSKEIISFDSKISLIDFLRNKIKAGDLLLIKGSRMLKMENIISSLGGDNVL